MQKSQLQALGAMYITPIKLYKWGNTLRHISTYQNFALKIRKIKQKEKQEFIWTDSFIKLFGSFYFRQIHFSFSERNFLSEQSLELCTFFEPGELNQLFQRFVCIYKL